MSPQRLKFLALRVYRSRDAQAYDELCDEYMQKVKRFVAHKLPRGEDADEVTGEVFLRGWEYMTANAVTNVSAFFYQIAKNLIADFYRSRKLTQPLGEMEDMVKAPGSSVENRLDAKDEVSLITEHLSKLKAEHSDILVMRFFNEMSISEIATVLNKNSNAVRVLLFRAKQALNRSLKKGEPE